MSREDLLRELLFVVLLVALVWQLISRGRD
jgi:hypothetical protein